MNFFKIQTMFRHEYKRKLILLYAKKRKRYMQIFKSHIQMIFSKPFQLQDLFQNQWIEVQNQNGEKRVTKFEAIAIIQDKVFSKKSAIEVWSVSSIYPVVRSLRLYGEFSNVLGWDLLMQSSSVYIKGSKNVCHGALGCR